MKDKKDDTDLPYFGYYANKKDDTDLPYFGYYANKKNKNTIDNDDFLKPITRAEIAKCYGLNSEDELDEYLESTEFTYSKW